MRTGARQATIRVFEPSRLAPQEKERLLGALEAFANLGDSLEAFLAFGKQNPTFFPVPIRDRGSLSREPLPEPCFKNREYDPHGPGQGKIVFWVKAIAWEPVCHKLALFYRDTLRLAWRPPRPGPFDISEEFLILLGLPSDLPGEGYAGREDEAFPAVRAVHPDAEIEIKNAIVADWKTGTFVYRPTNDFQRAAYILFREGWRAKVCEHCSRRFVADKPLQRYCSPACSRAVRLEAKLAWWNKHGKQARARRSNLGRRTRR